MFGWKKPRETTFGSRNQAGFHWSNNVLLEMITSKLIHSVDIDFTLHNNYATFLINFPWWTWKHNTLLSLLTKRNSVMQFSEKRPQWFRCFTGFIRLGELQSIFILKQQQYNRNKEISKWTHSKMSSLKSLEKTSQLISFKLLFIS